MFQLDFHFDGGDDLGTSGGAIRPPPVAESREGSEWPRSARDEGGNAEDIRRAPQQDVIAIN